MIKNVVFDIGNVLLEFKPYVYFKDYPQGSEVCDYIFHHDVWTHYDQGLVSLEEVKEALIKERDDYKEKIIYIITHWLDVLNKKDYSIQKLKTLKQEGYGVYLLSNLSLDATKHIDEVYGLFDMVDGYVLSYQENVCKPEDDIYHILCNRYNLNMNECVFLDDLKPNIEAAKILGMQGIVYESDEQVEKELSALLDRM